MVAHACGPSTWERETGRSSMHVPHQPGHGVYGVCSEFPAIQNCIDRPCLFFFFKLVKN